MKDSCTLHDRLLECQSQGLPGIPLHELLVYVRDVAEALDALHADRQLYGDVKPDNICLKDRHAWLAPEGAAPPSKYKTAGTPAYISPEVLRGVPECNGRDQYSLAATYAHMRFGRLPFGSQAHSLREVVEQHIKGTPELTPLPSAEQQVLLKALAKTPEQRFPSCQVFVQELDRVTEDD